MIGLKPAHVWDISQTDGEPIPETPRPALLQGQAPDGLWDGLADQITAHLEPRGNAGKRADLLTVGRGFGGEGRYELGLAHGSGCGSSGGERQRIFV